MKLFKKIGITILAATMAISSVAFTSCDFVNGLLNKDNSSSSAPVEEVPAQLTGVYGSGTFSFMSAYPAYTFKQLTFSTQTIKTYDDNTYELTVTSKNVSGALAFDPEDSGNTDTSGSNDRGQSVTIYSGTYTANEEEGLLTLSLATPDQYISVATGNTVAGVTYYNTAAWTEAMSTATEGKTASEYLATVAFQPVEVIVDTSTYGFDYISLTKLAEGTAVTAKTDASIKGVYGSGKFGFMSAYPAYTFKQVSGYTQTVVTYEDGTYEMTVATKNISGALAFDPEDAGNRDTSGSNDRGQSVVIYYGTYTSAEEEGLLTVNLSKPTKAVSVVTGNSTAGNAYTNSETNAEYLATVAFDATELIVDTSTYGFDYATLTVTKAE